MAHEDFGGLPVRLALGECTTNFSGILPYHLGIVSTYRTSFASVLGIIVVGLLLAPGVDAVFEVDAVSSGTAPSGIQVFPVSVTNLGRGVCEGATVRFQACCPRFGSFREVVRPLDFCELERTAVYVVYADDRLLILFGYFCGMCDERELSEEQGSDSEVLHREG